METKQQNKRMGREDNYPDWLDLYIAWVGGCTIAAFYGMYMCITHGIL